MKTDPDRLRADMVDRVCKARPISPAVEAAMRTVPRHRFVPNVPADEAYADIAVITKRGADGTGLSCASVPSLVGTMLDMLQVQPGQRILEIGAGTGYNAALLAQLAGTAGHVTTVDIDAEVTAQARTALDATGSRDVQVITRDGVLGVPENAPYDRMIVAVGAWDIPTAWWDQVAPGGRLVVPLRWRGQTRAVAFVHDGDAWRSDAVELCGFVPMVGQLGEHSGAIAANDEVTLFWDEDQAIDPNVLRDVLIEPGTTAWSGVTVGPNESFDGIWLRLTATEPGTCRIAAEPSAVASGLCAPAIPDRSPAIVDGDSLAYLTLRHLAQDEEQPRWELGATGHGGNGQDLSERLTRQIRAWNEDHDSVPTIAAVPTSHAGDNVEAEMIAKPNILLTVSF